MRVALFSTCLVDALFPDAGRATVRLLERLGQPVEFPLEQTCCGQMHANSGYFEPSWYADTSDVLSGYDAVVVPSGSCAGASAISIRWSPAPPATRRSRHARRGGRREDLRALEFLIDVLGSTTSARTSPTGSPITRHATRSGCSASATARSGCCETCAESSWSSCPRDEECCGFGGTFSIKNPDISAAMLADKMEAVIETGAEVLCAGDRSCLMHIGGGLERIRAGVRTLHLAEILASTEGASTERRPPHR